MKTVFESQELTHVWARQSQASGRASASIFFEGAKIYSYGYHFCIANIIKPNTVLFTTRRYSNTTAKHIGWVSYACNHMQKIYCAYPAGSLLDNLKAWQSEIDSLLKDLASDRKRPQTKDKIRGELAGIVTQVNEYLKVTEQKLSSKTHAEFIAYLKAAEDDQAKASLQKKLLRQQKEKEKREAAERAETMEKAQTELKAWSAGRGNRWHNYRHVELPIKLRVNPDNPERLETSKGASVQMKSAKLLYNMINAGKDVKGYDIDGYTVISINGVLKIGCHEIDRVEIERFAKKQGWK